MKTIGDQPVPFLLEFDDVKPLHISERPTGRRTSVWSAGIVRTLSVNGVADDPSRITLKKDEHIVIKTSWQLSRHRTHEHDVYKHMAMTEKQLVEEEGFVRDKDVAIPELVGTLCEDYQAGDNLACIGDAPLNRWTTREVRINPMSNDLEAGVEKAHFTILITKCRKAKPINHFILREFQMIEVYRRLVKNLEHVGLLGIHYRDLNIGNILCNLEDGFLCLLADFDFARIETKRRGEPREEHGDGELLDTSLDDCVSGNLHFMSQHVQKSRERNAALTRLRRAKHAIEAAAERNVQQASVEDRLFWENERITLLEAKQGEIDGLQNEIAAHYHKFVDDLESMIYTLLWLVRCLSP